MLPVIRLHSCSGAGCGTLSQANTNRIGPHSCTCTPKIKTAIHGKSDSMSFGQHQARYEANTSPRYLPGTAHVGTANDGLQRKECSRGTLTCSSAHSASKRATPTRDRNTRRGGLVTSKPAPTCLRKAASPRSRCRGLPLEYADKSTVKLNSSIVMPRASISDMILSVSIQAPRVA